METKLLMRIAMVPNASTTVQFATAVLKYYSLGSAATIGYLLNVAPRCLLGCFVASIVCCRAGCTAFPPAPVPEGTTPATIAAKLV